MSFSSKQLQRLPCALWSAPRFHPGVKGLHGCNGGSCLCCLPQDSANSPSQACLLGGLAGQCYSQCFLCTVSHQYFSHIPSPQTSAMPAKSQLTSCMRTSHSSCLFPWFTASMQRQLWHILLIPSLILLLSFQISSQPHFLGCADSEIHIQTWGRHFFWAPQTLFLLRAAWCRGSLDVPTKGHELIPWRNVVVPLTGL